MFICARITQINSTEEEQENDTENKKGRFD